LFVFDVRDLQSSPRNALARDDSNRESAGEPALFLQAWRARARHHPPTIRFDRPLDTLPVSLTGPSCALQCAHCGGHYLAHMRPIWEVDDTPATSLLISGGCDPQGRVPVSQHLERVAALRAGRRLNWHVGMIDEATLRTIEPYVDLVSFDVVGDRETAREVYGLDLDLDDYMRTYDLLRRRVRVVPHLTLGLRGGRMSGERRALEALAARDAGTVVFIVLIPTPGTRYADCAPPPLDEAARFLARARVEMPRARLYLGCMRPRGTYREALDEAAVRAGLNVIVNPARSAVEAAAEMGLTVEWGRECCALD